MQRRSRRKWVLGGTAAVAGAALLYKLYYSDRLLRAWRHYQELSAALHSYNQAFVTGAEVSAAISKDLKTFFQSDTTELPQSLRQLAHLFQAQETQAAARSLAAATVQGFLSAANVSPHGQPGARRPSDMLDKLLGLLVSEKGQTVVTLAVSVAARSATKTYCECVEQSAIEAKRSEEATGVLADSFLQQLMRFACTPQGERLCMLGVKNFVTNATEVYCDKLEGANFWQDLFAALSRPENKQLGPMFTRCFTNELINTWRKPANPTRSPAFQEEEAADSQPSTQEPASQQQAAGKGASARSQAQGGPSQQAAPARQPSALRLQARTALPPYWSSNQQGGKGTAQAEGQTGSSKPWYQTGSSAIAQEAIKVLRVPEGRMMLLSLSAIAVAEGIQTGYHGVKQMCTDSLSSGEDVALIDGGKVMGLSLRQLYAGLSVVVMLMLYVNGQRASLQAMQ